MPINDSRSDSRLTRLPWWRRDGLTTMFRASPRYGLRMVVVVFLGWSTRRIARTLATRRTVIIERIKGHIVKPLRMHRGAIVPQVLMRINADIASAEREQQDDGEQLAHGGGSLGGGGRPSRLRGAGVSVERTRARGGGDPPGVPSPRGNFAHAGTSSDRMRAIEPAAGPLNII